MKTAINPNPTPPNESASHIMYTVGKKLAVLGYALQIVAGIMAITLILGSTTFTATSLACTFLAAIVLLALTSGYLQQRAVLGG